MQLDTIRYNQRQLAQLIAIRQLDTHRHNQRQLDTIRYNQTQLDTIKDNYTQLEPIRNN